MEFIASQPIGQIAIELKEAAPLFEKYGIHYYLEKDKTLSEACQAARIPLDQVESGLKKSETLPSLWLAHEPDWGKESMASLIRYLVHVHHVKTLLLLDIIDRELSKLLNKNQEALRLGVVRDIFVKVNGESRRHMLEEEKMIFPYLVYAERVLARGEVLAEKAPKEKSFSDSIRNILFEHRFMDRGFAEIEKLVYLFRDDSGGKIMDPLVEALIELKKVNEKHVQLENEVLLKRAAQLGLMD